MGEKRCGSCYYFLQHYTLDSRKIFRVYCGHCTFDRVRRKQPDTKACEHYLQGLPQEDAFASKEYLSKELLQYVLNLERLPEVEDGTGI